jgi:ferredoxin-NADP reductase
MEATLDHIEDVAANIRTFWFRPEKPLQYVAGQYTQMYLPHTGADNRGEKRWFTLSSSPTESLLAITTKFAGQYGSSFKHVLQNLRPGTKVHLADPMGDFVLPKDQSVPLIFVAGGAGVTPVRSIVKYLLDSNEKRAVQLLQAVGSEPELVFNDLFKTYAPLQYSPIVSRPSDDWRGEQGRLDAARILRAAQAAPDSLIYLSGPEVLVERLWGDLKAAGVTAERLVIDFFHGYADI